MEKESYVWARVPPEMEGNYLLSRNSLAEISPEKSEIAAEKYEGRESLRDLYVKQLDCHWGDLIFLSPYDSHEQLTAFKEAGFKPRPQRYFKIPLSLVEQAGMECCWLQPDKHIHPLSFQDYQTPSLPEAQLEEYQTARAENRIPLAYGKSPHIILNNKGKKGLDVSQCEQVTVDVMGVQTGLAK